ncbi:hypothetical protein KZ483_11910 [Paenibacillus sp. sptzw28]|uniref:hypothetical protein n=1 Tax=Paenibacillus sp. sptzw28 TaxID=715179 RepID=UPI001C6F246D|nr:hypothetical protein [Paenibacillus sp. sptzw28]QYR23551.1 hypothetical protein KZ483_11910 [Paenibacillus sp. sptzw28]
MRKWVPLYAAVLLLLAGSQVSAAAGTSPAIPQELKSKLEIHVQSWIEMLSAQPQFQTWKKAAPVIVPIGPGQHGWLVSLSVDRKPVGYMIVNALENGGFSLGEYGVGSHPAFDPNTLYQSLVRQGLFDTYSDALKKPLKLERLYVHPLLAVWKWSAPDGQIRYLDAWSGEALPINNELWERQLTKQSFGPTQSTSGEEETKLSSSHLNKAFDPYERMPWLTKSPLTHTQLSRLPELLDSKAEIRFTAELYDGTVLFVWPTIGYHRWNNQTDYVAFEQDQGGTRFVPFNTISGGGRFYR